MTQQELADRVGCTRQTIIVLEQEMTFVRLNRLRLALPLAFVILAMDCASKDLAETYLTPEHVAHSVVGDVVRFTLAYNNGTAMSLPIGSHARWPLVVVSLIAAAVLLRYIWLTPPHATARRIALGLLLGGTIGNLISRAFSHRGVVDFIDIGFGARRFYLFNVANVGITFGVCLLAITLQRATRNAVTYAETSGSERTPPTP
jgi:signal peptidase II